MKTVLVDPYLSDECKCSLASLGFDVREIPVWQGLSGSVSSHPDMLMALLPDGGAMAEFLEENEVTAVMLSGGPLSDHGGLLVI